MNKAKSTQRKALSKKLRFEVFKRDKFTCVYCGRKAPDVVLEVDHITPVAKGGDNNIINLVTSCFECNRGKKDIPLHVNESLEKQRLQMELIQEKREQLEMLFEWKKSLDELDEYGSELYVEYIESKIEPYTLSNQFKTNILKLFKKYKPEDIFDAIKISTEKYLKYDSNNELIQESVNECLGKIGGILVNKNLPPIKQKLSYIKGICRNRFNYWDDRKGSMILNDYVKALISVGWTENQILEDLENEVIKISKESKNWSEWRQIIENWTSQIYSWENDENNKFEVTNEEIQSIIDSSYAELCFYIEFIKYSANIFGKYNNSDIVKTVVTSIIKYNQLQYEKLCRNESIENLSPRHKVYIDIGLFDFIKNIDSSLKIAFDCAISAYTNKVFIEELYYNNDKFGNIDNFFIFQKSIETKLKELINDE